MTAMKLRVNLDTLAEPMTVAFEGRYGARFKIGAAGNGRIGIEVPTGYQLKVGPLGEGALVLESIPPVDGDAEG